jgi:hypothetical protein
MGGFIGMLKVLNEIEDERDRQDEKWGEQNHPDRDPLENHHVETGLYAFRAQRWKDINADRADKGRIGWDGILLEEVYEAISEVDPAKLRAELIQVAAVAAAWVDAIDRRPVTQAGEN